MRVRAFLCRPHGVFSFYDDVFLAEALLQLPHQRRVDDALCAALFFQIGEILHHHVVAGEHLQQQIDAPQRCSVRTAELQKQLLRLLLRLIRRRWAGDGVEVT